MTEPTALTAEDRVRQHERVMQATGMLGQLADDLSLSEVAGLGIYIKTLAADIWAIGNALLDGEGVEGICRLCGCTVDNPCDGGCSWVDETETVCSTHLATA